MTSPRWDEAVFHCGSDTGSFVAQYFSSPDRSVLFIGGAGFDPRSTAVLGRLIAAGMNGSGILIREERAGASSELRERGDSHATTMGKMLKSSETLSVDIFAPDGAVIGPKRMLREMSTRVGPHYTDIVVDMSALSIGMSFPLVRFLYEQSIEGKLSANVHLFVTPDAELDSRIRADHSDTTIYVPGFGGGAQLDSNSGATRLWIPQLVDGKKESLRRIHAFLESPETCPILPFPAVNLRRADELIEEFMTELDDAWEVDSRNLIYAAEEEPLDLYRTLLRLASARDRVFQDHGGSLLILSPIGSKCLALGALLAALERDFPVAYVEALSYSVGASVPSTLSNPPEPVHLWLTGEVYA